jgi:hypothetical protein
MDVSPGQTAFLEDFLIAALAVDSADGIDEATALTDLSADFALGRQFCPACGAEQGIRLDGGTALGALSALQFDPASFTKRGIHRVHRAARRAFHNLSLSSQLTIPARAPKELLRASTAVNGTQVARSKVQRSPFEDAYRREWHQKRLH